MTISTKTTLILILLSFQCLQIHAQANKETARKEQKLEALPILGIAALCLIASLPILFIKESDPDYQTNLCEKASSCQCFVKNRPILRKRRYRDTYPSSRIGIQREENNAQNNNNNRNNYSNNTQNNNNNIRNANSSTMTNNNNNNAQNNRNIASNNNIAPARNNNSTSSTTNANINRNTYNRNESRTNNTYNTNNSNTNNNNYNANQRATFNHNNNRYNYNNNNRYNSNNYYNDQRGQIVEDRRRPYNQTQRQISPSPYRDFSDPNYNGSGRSQQNRFSQIHNSDPNDPMANIIVNRNTYEDRRQRHFTLPSIQENNRQNENVNPVEIKLELNTEVKDDLSLCKHCKKRDRTIQFLPCKHIVCCSSCARMIMSISQTCPECRSQIQQVVSNQKPAIKNTVPDDLLCIV